MLRHRSFSLSSPGCTKFALAHPVLHHYYLVVPMTDRHDDEYNPKVDSSSEEERLILRKRTYRRPHNDGHNADESESSAEQQTSNYEVSSLLCGLLAGIAQAGVFNSYDRALYLSIREERPFLHAENWKHPYQGFFQSLNTRALAGGLYFPAEHFALRTFPEHHFVAGMVAGTINAVLLNPLTAVKYKTWGRAENRGVLTEILHMASVASWRPFVKGLTPTILRDVVFGGTYTLLRLNIAEYTEVPTANFCAAMLATVLSGPFNYVRNIQFATRSLEPAKSVPTVLTELTRETMAVHGVLNRLSFVQTKLRIGWGTARVAMGMSFAHGVYDWLHEWMETPS